MEIWREFTFEAAHLLPNVPEGHKCRRLHGHSYRVKIFVEGDLDRLNSFTVAFLDALHDRNCFCLKSGSIVCNGPAG